MNSDVIQAGQASKLNDRILNISKDFCSEEKQILGLLCILISRSSSAKRISATTEGLTILF